MQKMSDTALVAQHERLIRFEMLANFAEIRASRDEATEAARYVAPERYVDAWYEVYLSELIARMESRGVVCPV